MYQIKLSPYAKIFYVDWLLDQDSFRYNVPCVQTLYGKLDVQRLEQALIKYVSSHLLLNSHIQEVDGEPYWVKNDAINELEYCDYPVEDADLLKYVTHRFDLYCGPLYRFKLVRLDEEVYRFIVVLHHLVMDGISSNIGVFETISHYYNDANYNTQYSIDEQIQLMTSLSEGLSVKVKQNRIKYEEFWRQQLSNMESVDLNFLKLNGEPKAGTTEFSNPIGEIQFSFGGSIPRKLDALKSQYSITPYRYGQGILALLLHRYTAQQQLAITYPVSIKEGIEFVYGAQLNMSLIPYRFENTTTIGSLLKQSKDFSHAIKQGEMHYYPITDLFNTLNTSMRIDKRLLNITFSQTFFMNKPFAFFGIAKVEVSSAFHIDAVPKEMLLFEQEPTLKDNKLHYRVRYDKRTIDTTLLDYFLNVYRKIFLEVLDDLLSGNEDKLVSSYRLLDDVQYKQVIDEFNQVDKNYPKGKTLHRLFEEQVMKTPHNTAVIDALGSCTYLDIKTKADRLAAELCIATGNACGQLIAILSEKGRQQVIAALAILKSGNAYLPLSVDYPLERVKQILEEGQAKILLVSDAQRAKVVHTPLAEDYGVMPIEGKTSFPLDIQFPEVKADQLAYVIFTSGSTGKPKGVAVCHHSAVNTLYAVNERFQVNERNRVLALSELSFDLSVYDIFGLLAAGGAIVFPAPGKMKEPPHWLSLIKQYNVDIWNTVPQLLQLLIEHAKMTHQSIGSLKSVLLSGDWIPLELPEQIKLYNPRATVMSLGGATEGSIWSIWYEISEVKPDWPSIPYGRAMPNQRMYILDDHLQPLPMGVIGEIFIGGEGVALGYWNDPEKTSASFIEHPTLGRIYKTGDLGRWSKEGQMEIHGRKDNQIKIGGYRIELGEIENKLISYPGITHAIVIAKNLKNNTGKFTSNQCLVAYYMANNKIDEEKLYRYLEDHLPEYMVPSALVFLKEIPLTSNGKLDRAALPDPIFEKGKCYIAPRNEKEVLICEAFSKVLGTETVNVHDDFFNHLSGTSLDAIRLVTFLHINFDVKVMDIFNLRTPARLAEHIPFGGAVLKQKLESVKAFYKNQLTKSDTFYGKRQDKITFYLENTSKLQIDASLKKPIANILLTGATGYLGCNILYQLLNLTQYNIFLLIRGESEERAIKRLNKKFQFYFDRTLDNVYNLRVFIFNGDIEKDNLGLSLDTYQTLVEKMDSVIHAAALVKHYGDYNMFYSANVQGTMNLLDFTRLTRLKDFHHISTYSVLNYGLVQSCDEYTCTEDDLPDNLQQSDNVYVQTKLQAEKEVITYRKYGVNSNIYRVGNLAFNASNYRAQENIEDNAFFNWIQCLFKMQCVAQDINWVEVSPVDCTAQAIVKLFDKCSLGNSIYHVFNPHLFNISDAFSYNNTSPVSALTIDEFVDNIICYLSNNVYHDLIIRFLLHQGWMDGRMMKDPLAIKILQDRTTHILKQLGFEWPQITGEKFNKYLALLKL